MIIPCAARVRRVLGCALTLFAHAACTPGDKSGETPRDTSIAAARPAAELPKVRVVTSPFGALPSGQKVQAFTLTNAHGVAIRAIDYGGIITSLSAPDRAGVTGDIVLGYDNIDGYLKTTPYFGAIVGRYANRIAKGRFTLDGATYTLATNNGANALHGGVTGFDKVMWHAEPFDSASGAGVVFTYTAKDGEEGYPGALTARVTYTLNNDNQLSIEYSVTSTRATPVNLSQHSYFNLAGDGSGTILNHQVQIAADSFTPVDTTLIPTGVLQPVTGTPFDFRTSTAIGARISDTDVQLKIAGGYDHNFVLNRKGDGMAHAARVVEPVSGRTLDVSTTEPGIQFYTGNFLDGSITGKGGHVYRHRNGFCLETQHFPDSPNQKSFPSTILRPGSEYRSRTVYTFGVQR
jgi:aldose 1-epimerase